MSFRIKNMLNIVTVLSLMLASGSLLASTLIANTPVLTLDGAKVIASAAAKKAKAENWNVVIAITDAAGNVKYLERMENVQLASLEVAIQKAKTAVLYRRPTQIFEEKINDGWTPATMLPNVLPFAGGLPIKVDGKLIGAIGVSGVKSSQDAEIAQAGINALLEKISE